MSLSRIGTQQAYEEAVKCLIKVLQGTWDIRFEQIGIPSLSSIQY
jgi:hypothetical protein